MRSASRFLYDALVEGYYSFSELLMFNLLWAFFTLLAVTAAPAAAGLYYATNQMAHRRPVSWRTFFDGFRTHFWLGWRWGLANLLLAVVLGFSFWFYGQVQSGWGVWLQGACLALAALWALLQVYTFPLLLEQADRRQRTALRNSLVFYVRRPGFCLAVSLFLGLLVAISTFLLPPAWFLLTASLCAYMANRVTIQLIEDLGGSSAGPQ